MIARSSPNCQFLWSFQNSIFNSGVVSSWGNIRIEICKAFYIWILQNSTIIKKKTPNNWQKSGSFSDDAYICSFFSQMKFAAILVKQLLSILPFWNTSRLLWFPWLLLEFLIISLHGKIMTSMWCLQHSICFGLRWSSKFGSAVVLSWATAGGLCWWSGSLRSPGQGFMGF